MSHTPINYSLGQLKIELNPFYWHGCEFMFENQNENWSWLISWTKKWIDENDTNPTDNLGFSKVIHNVTRPTKMEFGDFSFGVDFGTATEDSFMELIQEIEKQKIRKLRVGSFNMIG